MANTGAEAAVRTFRGILWAPTPLPRGSIRNRLRGEQARRLRRVLSGLGVQGIRVYCPRLRGGVAIELPTCCPHPPASACELCTLRARAEVRLVQLVLRAFPDMADPDEDDLCDCAFRVS